MRWCNSHPNFRTKLRTAKNWRGLPSLYGNVKIFQINLTSYPLFCPHLPVELKYHIRISVPSPLPFCSFAASVVGQLSIPQRSWVKSTFALLALPANSVLFTYAAGWAVRSTRAPLLPSDCSTSHFICVRYSGLCPHWRCVCSCVWADWLLQFATLKLRMLLSIFKTKVVADTVTPCDPKCVLYFHKSEWNCND